MCACTLAWAPLGTCDATDMGIKGYTVSVECSWRFILLCGALIHRGDVLVPAQLHASSVAGCHACFTMLNQQQTTIHTIGCMLC
jgi:hypothetical protein